MPGDRVAHHKARFAVVAGRICSALFLVALAGVEVQASELAPGGTLRATYIATNPVQASVDPATGELRGPAAAIAQELARREGIAVAIRGAAGVAGVIDSVRSGAADIGFVAYDALRAADVDFSQTYALAQNTYAVLAASGLRSCQEVDRAGIRVTVAERDAGDFFLTRNLRQATLRRVPPGNAEAALKLLLDGEVEAYAANRQRLSEMAARMPAIRVLPDNFYGVEQAVIVPKGNAAALAIVDRFLDEARGSGLIKAAIDRAGLVGVDVAPPRSEQRR
jgi:polar amino acid transport system substrate-binding protein